MVRISRINQLKIKQWWFNTWMHKFIYVYMGAPIQIIYLLFKFKFDADRITVQLDLMKKDSKYRYDKAVQENKKLTQQLKEQRERHEEIRSKGYGNPR